MQNHFPWPTYRNDYDYQEFPIAAIYQDYSAFSAKPGNYIFARQEPNTPPWPLYIGETSNLRERLVPSHERMDCVCSAGATLIYIHENNDESARRAEERDLIDFYNPSCNRTGEEVASHQPIETPPPASSPPGYFKPDV